MIADPGIVSLIQVPFPTFVEIDSEIFFFYGHSPPSTNSRRATVGYKRMYVHLVLVNF